MSLVVETDKQDLIFRAALLAGLGPQARKAAAASPLTTGHAREETGKTCIDAGGMMMFSLHSARPGELGILRRLTGGTEGVQPWLWTNYRRVPAGIETDAWNSWIFSGEGKAHFSHVWQAVEKSGEITRFREVHAELGRRGRFVFAIQPVDPPGLPTWIGWQLDKHTRPADALRAIGYGELWPHARKLMQQFLGSTLTDRSHPWSVAVGFGSEGFLVRVGSTIWARQPEIPGKYRRLASCFREIGGDDRTVEAIYKLLLPARAEPYTRVGRAIEIEFCDDQFRGVQLLLLAGKS